MCVCVCVSVSVRVLALMGTFEVVQNKPYFCCSHVTGQICCTTNRLDSHKLQLHINHRVCLHVFSCSYTCTCSSNGCDVDWLVRIHPACQRPITDNSNLTFCVWASKGHARGLTTYVALHKLHSALSCATKWTFMGDKVHYFVPSFTLCAVHTPTHPSVHSAS